LCVYSVILSARSVRFHRCSPVMRSAAASAVVSRSDCLKRRSRRYSLTDAWLARTGNLVLGLAREGYASFFRPTLWLFGGGLWWLGVAGDSGCGACVARADSGSDWSSLALAVDVFCLDCIFFVFSQCIFAMS